MISSTVDTCHFDSVQTCHAGPDTSHGVGNVLIVEDDVDTADTLVRLLSQEGFGVRAVSNRDEALTAMERYLYQVVVLDFWMPGLRAKPFLKEASRRFPRTKFVLITAGESAKKTAESLGLKYWIPKPLMPEEVIDRLRELTHD